MLSHSTKNQTKENKTKQQTAISFFLKKWLSFYNMKHITSNPTHLVQKDMNVSQYVLLLPLNFFTLIRCYISLLKQ